MLKRIATGVMCALIAIVTLFPATLANAEEDGTDITQFTPVIQVNSVEHNDAVPGTVVATLSMPAEYKGGDVTYKLVNSSDNDYDEMYKCLEIKGNNIVITDLSSAGFDFVDREGDTPKLKQGNFGVMVKAVDSEGHESKALASGDIEIKEDTGENLAYDFKLNTLQYYVGPKEKAAVSDGEWKDVSAEDLVKINNEDGKGTEAVDVDFNTDISAKKLENMNLWIRYTADKEGVKSDFDNNIMKKDHEVKDGALVFKHLEMYKGSWTDSCSRVFNIHLHPGKGSNIAQMKPVIKVKNSEGLQRKDAVPGAVLATLSMPGGRRSRSRDAVHA